MLTEQGDSVQLKNRDRVVGGESITVILSSKFAPQLASFLGKLYQRRNEFELSKIEFHTSSLQEAFLRSKNSSSMIYITALYYISARYALCDLLFTFTVPKNLQKQKK